MNLVTWNASRELKFVSVALAITMASLLIVFLLKVRLLTQEATTLTRPDKDQAVWTATQIQYELVAFESHLKDVTDRLDADTALRFDMLYSRVAQAQETNVISLLPPDAGDVSRQMIGIRDEMAAVIDGDPVIDPQDRATLFRLLDEARTIWAPSLNHILHAARQERIALRLRAGDVIASARNYFLVSLALLIAAALFLSVSILWRSRARRFQRMVEHDALTGCLSRYGLDAVFASEVFRATETKTAAVVDLNGLKQINDTYGHAVGDLAIQAAARTLKDAVRDSDYVARIGGDEFWLVLMTDSATAQSVMERAAQAFSQVRLQTDTVTIPLSVSFGVFPIDPRSDIAAAFDAADKGMYRQKSTFYRAARN